MSFFGGREGDLEAYNAVQLQLVSGGIKAEARPSAAFVPAVQAQPVGPVTIYAAHVLHDGQFVTVGQDRTIS